MRTSRRLVVLLASVAASSMLWVACNKSDHGPGAPDPVNVAPAQPTSGGTAAAPAPVTGGGTGIKVELVSSTFDPDRCTQLRDKDGNLTSFGKLAELVEVDKISNFTTMDVYPKPSIFHTDIATCGALDSNPGNAKSMLEAETVEPGKSGNWTHRFPVDEEACGAYQFDNAAFNGDLRVFVLGKVINTGRNCPSCAAFDVQLTITGEGLTRTVKVTFAGQKPAKKALVDFGDGTSAQVANKGTVSHTWPYGEYIVKATLEAEGVSCYSSAKVTNEKPCQVEWIEQEPEITYGEWGECKPPAETSSSTVKPECSQSRSVRTVIKEKNSCTGEVRIKSDKTTTESRPCECKKDSCDNYNPPVFGGALALTDQTEKKVTVTSGTVTPAGGSFHPSLPKTVNRPDPGEPDDTFETDYTVSYGPAELKCEAKHEYTIKIPAQTDPCATTPAPVVTVSCTPNPYYDQAVECTATSSVSAKFDWDRDALAASIVASCSTSDKKTYTKQDLDNKNWKISVTATACDECKKTGSKSVDLIVNPPVGACYYKVDGESEADKEVTCNTTKGGYTPVFGIWLNFDHGSLSNHCMFPVNGLSNRHFQLTPGQSDPSCLNKND